MEKKDANKEPFNRPDGVEVKLTAKSINIKGFLFFFILFLTGSYLFVYPAGSNTNRGFHFKSYSYYQIQYLTKPNTLSINYHKIPGSHSVSSHSTTFSNSIKCEAFTKIVSPSWIIPGSASLRLSFSAKCTISFVQKNFQNG